MNGPLADELFDGLDDRTSADAELAAEIILARQAIAGNEIAPADAIPEIICEHEISRLETGLLHAPRLDMTS
jgi:hypothetical protein